MLLIIVHAFDVVVLFRHDVDTVLHKFAQIYPPLELCMVNL